MSEGAPINWLPRRVNPRKLAYSGGKIAGAIDPQALPRLADAVLAVERVDINVMFDINEEGKLVTRGDIEAVLAFECQRCMKPMAAESVIAALSAAIVRDEEDAKGLPKALEPWIVEGEEADLYEFVEDELLLSLPVVAYHDQQCIDPSLLQAGDEKVEEAIEEKANPFSVLSVLKDKSSDK